MRRLALLFALLLSTPAWAAPFGPSVAGLAKGAFRLDLTYDYGSRTLGFTPDEGEETRTGLSTGGVSLSATVEPCRYISFEGRFLVHQPRVEAMEYTGPASWGFGAGARITPVHAGDGLFHLGAYGFLDGQYVGGPTDDLAPLRLYTLRAGLGVGLGDAQRGWYAELGGHYSYGWGEFVLPVTEMDEDTGESETTYLQYDTGLPRPFGIRLGAGLFSGPIAPAHNTRSKLYGGVDIRLVDEWAVSVRFGVIL